MKRINMQIIAVLITMLCISQFAAAQSFSATENLAQEGLASWYGPGFEGRPTASGELFDSSQFTAAHPSLPFGTFLLVTNKDNNRQVAVRVNDRGPFVPERIIDVSRAAAEQLDMTSRGVAYVSIEVIRLGHPLYPERIMPPNFLQEKPPSVSSTITTTPPPPPPILSLDRSGIPTSVITTTPPPPVVVTETYVPEKPITIIIYPPNTQQGEP
ncbi:MAG: septal ring lytic transglycosylase RlpA family protein, partial [Treponema sp.]|nr:septal ring lytic transglycosylase RlpA family protein [Treponema sp.]